MRRNKLSAVSTCVGGPGYVQRAGPVTRRLYTMGIQRMRVQHVPTQSETWQSRAPFISCLTAEENAVRADEASVSEGDEPLPI